jgi:carboxymethylenebutenolidase
MYEPNQEALANSQASVLAFFGEKDGYTPPEYIQKVGDAFRNAGKNYEARVYPAGHAFVNPVHGDGHEESARDAWPRAVNFLKEHLTQQ